MTVLQFTLYVFAILYLGIIPWGMKSLPSNYSANNSNTAKFAKLSLFNVCLEDLNEAADVELLDGTRSFDPVFPPTCLQWST